MSATDLTMDIDSEDFTVPVDGQTDLPATEDAPPRLPAYIVVKEEGYSSLTDAVEDVEAQLLDGEPTYRDDLLRMHNSLLDWDPPASLETGASSETSDAMDLEESGGDSGETVEVEDVPEYWDTDGVDWNNNPPVWDGHTIPVMDAEVIHTYIDDQFIKKEYPVTCKMGNCTQEIKGKGCLKSHLWGLQHLNIRRVCRRCNRSRRRDNFSGGHSCKA
ncbi:hypothetical protein L226DRAFT_562893 [Lentinus tigrinus ALCF2SS1-7]|uniref:Uncharacterized protein n=1 Tax=Lentinus tigrinus ALCF2SS1-6 TaxID=1328759 RepID=A0A5C2RWD9_9APHY|nr:hypothetical protein L227DRAFT_603683 [Lentinus tigrinus ALCF2SS1-6]RPD70373.1 hypothetical protein L226DRAFT_562893 [Lentinus tigrinus ALCF2SS1-7]